MSELSEDDKGAVSWAKGVLWLAKEPCPVPVDPRLLYAARLILECADELARVQKSLSFV